MSKFTTAAKARTAVEFELDEVKFTFTPPKQAAMIMPILENGTNEYAVIEAGLNWFRDGLPEDQHAIIVARLKDPKDDFDLEDFQDIIEWLVGQVSGERPIL